MREITREITKDRVREGMQRGVVSFVVDPNTESGTVCQIGDSWFYFGGLSAEEHAPPEYLSNMHIDDIVDDIYVTLYEFKESGECFADEYAYYDSILYSNGI